VTAIRPPSWPAVQTPTQGTGGARTAAQRAFFDAALGKAAPAVAPASVVQTRPEPAPEVIRVRTVRVENTEQPTRILRPGSLLDIRV